MIIQENGRWRSICSISEEQQEINELLAKFSDKEREALNSVLNEFKSKGKSKLADQCAQLEWEEVPVPIEVWVNSYEHIGETGETLYPTLKKDLIELFSGSYHEVIMTGATSIGKDYFATTAVMRLLYELCCLKNPPRSLGLGAGEPIHIAPISRTVKAARDVVFGGILKKLQLSPWFRNRFKETMDYVEFPDKKIRIVGGMSSAAAALGLNVFGAILDETNFMGNVRAADDHASVHGSDAAPDRAQMTYDSLVRRVRGRYKRSGLKGMIFLISSKRATDDFTERRIRDHIKNNTTAGVFVRDYCTWTVKPESFANQKFYKCAVSASEGRCRILEDGEIPPADALVFDFPEDYLSEFKRDPVAATRDLAGIATESYAPFISRRDAIDSMFDHDMIQVFDTPEWKMGNALTINWHKSTIENERRERVPLCCSHAARHVHIDLSKNMCATGFVMAHQAGFTEVIRFDPVTKRKNIEEAPVFHIDAVLKIQAGPAGDIDHGEVRGLIYKLNEGGFNIRSVSLDHWMSVPNMQLLKKQGFRVEEISTVKKIDPYDTMRSAMYENRIKCPTNAHLDKELRSLELDPKTASTRPKITVPSGHTKDVSDAFAGAVYYLASNTRGGDYIPPSLGVSTNTKQNNVSWSNGDIIWNDEEGYESLPDPAGGDDDPYNQSWFMMG